MNYAVFSSFFIIAASCVSAQTLPTFNLPELNAQVSIGGNALNFTETDTTANGFRFGIIGQSKREKFKENLSLTYETFDLDGKTFGTFHGVVDASYAFALSEAGIFYDGYFTPISNGLDATNTDTTMHTVGAFNRSSLAQTQLTGAAGYMIKSIDGKDFASTTIGLNAEYTFSPFLSARGNVAQIITSETPALDRVFLRGSGARLNFGDTFGGEFNYLIYVLDDTTTSVLSGGVFYAANIRKQKVTIALEYEKQSSTGIDHDVQTVNLNVTVPFGSARPADITSNYSRMGGIPTAQQFFAAAPIGLGGR